MIKKLLILLTFMLPLAVQAQLAVGSWKIHSPFINVEDIAETGTYIYFVSAGSVFRYDKETTEVESLTKVNILNDVDAKYVYSDPDAENVIVVYNSGNMDRLWDNGKVVNMPDIKNANNVGSHNINDIAFNGDDFYVATDFGLVVYNNSKNEVRETVFTPKEAMYVDASSQLVAMGLKEGALYVAPSDISIKNLSDFTAFSIGMADCHGLIVKEDNIFWCLWGGISRIYNIDINTVTLDIDAQIEVDGQNQTVRDCNNWKIYRGSHGYDYVFNSNGIFTFDKDGKVSKLSSAKVPETSVLLYGGDAASVWEGDGNGLRQMDYSAQEPVALGGYIKGSDLSLKQIHAMYTGQSGKIYLHGLDQNSTINAYYDRSKPSTVLTLENGEFKDVAGKEVDFENGNSGVRGPHAMMRTHRLCEDPQDPDAYYIGSFFEGVYHIKDNKQLHKYYATSAGFEMAYNYACNLYAVGVDNFGNLWVYDDTESSNDSSKRIHVLSSENRNKTVTTPSDWQGFSVKGKTSDNWENFILPCRKSNYTIITLGKYEKDFVLVDSRNTPSPSDDRLILVDTQIDQDGKEFDSAVGFTCVAEDNNGRLWFGSEKGVYEITDISKVTSNVASIKRMKVARNDGTNLADYLLENVTVSGIAVDAANKKWISTIGSGVYLVSENGDRILEHYTVDNSILPSNHIYSVACDPASNKVYFGTPNGLVEYSSTTSPAADSYSDVYAYPNPVRPDYTGWITVTGLMDNSLVKIADANGNVCHQGRSEGGMFVWDGCNSAGERVKTGVYYVLASQNATGTSSACVTKIMVIN